MMKYLQLLAIALGQIGLTVVLFGLHVRYWGTNLSQDLSTWTPAILACVAYFLFLLKGFPNLRKGLPLLASLAVTLILPLLSSGIALVAAVSVIGE